MESVLQDINSVHSLGLMLNDLLTLLQQQHGEIVSDD